MCAQSDIGQRDRRAQQAKDKRENHIGREGACQRFSRQKTRSVPDDEKEQGKQGYSNTAESVFQKAGRYTNRAAVFCAVKHSGAEDEKKTEIGNGTKDRNQMQDCCLNQGKCQKCQAVNEDAAAHAGEPHSRSRVAGDIILQCCHRLPFRLRSFV